MTACLVCAHRGVNATCSFLDAIGAAPFQDHSRRWHNCAQNEEIRPREVKLQEQTELVVAFLSLLRKLSAMRRFNSQWVPARHTKKVQALVWLCVSKTSVRGAYENHSIDVSGSFANALDGVVTQETQAKEAELPKKEVHTLSDLHSFHGSLIEKWHFTSAGRRASSASWVVGGLTCCGGSINR